jgi:hypothetical protein
MTMRRVLFIGAIALSLFGYVSCNNSGNGSSSSDSLNSGGTNGAMSDSINNVNSGGNNGTGTGSDTGMNNGTNGSNRLGTDTSNRGTSGARRDSL